MLWPFKKTAQLRDGSVFSYVAKMEKMGSTIKERKSLGLVWRKAVQWMN